MENLAQYADWAYLIGAVLFILALRGLSSPASAIMGNRYGMFGMGLAVVSTFVVVASLKGGFVAVSPAYALILGAMVAGAAIGMYRARTVPMTQMPETVALMHSLVGLAAVLIAIAAVKNPSAHHDAVHRFELFVGCFVGAVTFTASVFAYGKLAAKKWAKSLKGGWVKPLQALLAAGMIGFGVAYFATEQLSYFYVMTAFALVFGLFWIGPIGGGDMPVVVSLLNSFSGWAAAGIGFTLNNSMLIIAGSLVGSSGAILSYVMCRAMNRSLLNVLFGGFGAAAAGGADDGEKKEKNYKSGSADDAAFMMGNADSVVIVPGYGLAQARAQNAVKELADALKEKGVKVNYAIHPVAGRMPGHMNVLLAEADVPYEDVKEMDEINSDFAGTDVVLIIGANDVVNPAAKNDPSSPIYGMPILEAQRARTVMVIKRSMNPGYAGLDNDIFYMDKTMMIFGDAKKVVEEMLKSLSGGGH
ncbi:MAG TPA: NAD(P)(+) transhydrogenase (Re/Si-specific) subunit beta [Moraxellaceae bacterium]|nr:NAD(P)(+) transhydrogenase (Re/Si-specific) subunit beta [Moraxellaceae bacterium]